MQPIKEALLRDVLDDGRTPREMNATAVRGERGPGVSAGEARNANPWKRRERLAQGCDASGREGGSCTSIVNAGGERLNRPANDALARSLSRSTN